jgi:hypothetical protein
MGESISVEGWLDPPPDRVLKNLQGAVLNVCVGGTIGPDPVPFGDFFRFALVTGIAWTSNPFTRSKCAHCKRKAKFQITVQWETGYDDPGGNVICENCVSGVVTSGATGISFGGQPSSPVQFSVQVKHDLKGLKR